jgi:hypothetical protein
MIKSVCAKASRQDKKNLDSQDFRSIAARLAEAV